MHNLKSNVFDLYAALFQYALQGLVGSDVYLALDTSPLFDRFILIRVALIYPGRAIPVYWSIGISFGVPRPSGSSIGAVKNCLLCYAIWVGIGVSA